MGLPAAKLIAKVEQANNHIIVMERIAGLRWSEKDSLNFRKEKYSPEDIISLLSQAEEKMNELKARFDAAGVIRKWKLKDMVFQIDIENKKLISVVPTDWERTTILKKL